MRISLISLLLLVASTATAAPAADLVIVWAPGMRTAPIEAVARSAGAAVLDRSPAPAAVEDVGPLIRRGIEAYDGLRLDEAHAALDAARALVDRTGDASATQLSDLFLYRALVTTQTGDTAAAWDELVAAVVVAPERVLDPARFPPRVVADYARAQAAVAERPRATLTVTAPAGCTVAIDGTPRQADAALPAGAHWVHVGCPDRAPWGARVEVTAPGTAVTAQPIAFAAPSDADVMIQARTAGSRAVIAVEVHAAIATVRLIGIDGRERDRRTVAATAERVADVVRQLLQPAESPHWYRSRWAWAAGAAAIAAAILIPVTAAIVHDTRASSATIRPPSPW